jgi:phenylalanyl-tRNA synthetase alpha chain
MQATLDEIRQAVQAYQFTDRASLDAYRSQYSGRKGVLQALFGQLKTVAAEDRRTVGQALNELKTLIDSRLAEGEALIAATSRRSDQPADLSLPPLPGRLLAGSRHPIVLVERKIVETFAQIGFTVAEGPEVETDWANFTALNFEADHPAREMQDTFFVRRAGQPDEHTGQPTAEDVLLRTHTSTVQVRLMQSQAPPIRALMPGRVYRNEAISARAHCFFHQIEGLVVDEHQSLADLKQTLDYFARSLFGPSVRTRLRPSYFPFTEISAEMDISCQVCDGDGCAVCKHTGWVEILGCGMVDPAVLAHCGIDPERYSGYAFGVGVERLAMMLHKVPDLRLFAQNDVRFLQQFATLG